MANSKSRNIQRNSRRKRRKPKVRFNLWNIILFVLLSFTACFIGYMVKANADPDFLEDEFGTITVEESADKNKTATSDTSETEDNSEDGEAEEETTAAPKADITNPVPQSEPAESGYLDNCCLITDSTLLDMASFSNFTDVIGSEALNAISCNTAKVSTNYGTVTVNEAMQIKKPENLYIMLGSDIGTSPVDEMIENYGKLIGNLHSSRPEMNIYIMQLPPAKGEDASKNELINEYNSKLLDIANKNQVYCIDTNTPLKNESGSLAPDFIDGETNKFNEAAYGNITSYILTHVAS